MNETVGKRRDRRDPEGLCRGQAFMAPLRRKKRLVCTFPAQSFWRMMMPTGQRLGR
jgi:hypothetical protein